METPAVNLVAVTGWKDDVDPFQSFSILTYIRGFAMSEWEDGRIVNYTSKELGGVE